MKKINLKFGTSQTRKQKLQYVYCPRSHKVKADEKIWSVNRI